MSDLMMGLCLQQSRHPGFSNRGTHIACDIGSRKRDGVNYRIAANQNTPRLRHRRHDYGNRFQRQLFQHGINFKADAAAQRGINTLGKVVRAARLQLLHRGADLLLGFRFRQRTAVAANDHRRILHLIAGEGFSIEERGGF